MSDLSGGRYPRDMVGYGRDVPHARWPGDARVAVQFVLNYEEGGENNILHGDAASEAFLSEIPGAVPFPGMRHINMESIYEYGSRVGFWRLLRMFDERQWKFTSFAVTSALLRNPDAAYAMRASGHEIASHGLKWIDYTHVPVEIERAHIREAVRLHTEICGERPLGFYQGRMGPNTRALCMEEGGFVYDADSYADELPYYVPDVTPGREGRPHLIVPYTLDANDMRFSTTSGFSQGEDFFVYLRDAFDQLWDEGAERPRMLSVGLHCRLVGRPGRARALARFMDHIAARDRVWVARRIDIARHWLATHPPAPLA
ncbi:MAG: allantoinase PuuE [Myxococcota bacterium]